MSNLQPNCCLEFEFRKVDQHAGGKWLIHDTKRRKDNHILRSDGQWNHEIRGFLNLLRIAVYSESVNCVIYLFRQIRAMKNNYLDMNIHTLVLF